MCLMFGWRLRSNFYENILGTKLHVEWAFLFQNAQLFQIFIPEIISKTPVIEFIPQIKCPFFLSFANALSNTEKEIHFSEKGLIQVSERGRKPKLIEIPYLV